ncbi:MAG: class I SAM-dependent methyltransferase [FCB group bacterium]|nr:class I SAM-dependent methyltransferase [FCB group bacterium]MBL7027376.1 class I SAM-dependent methyltransferase [Candidatus Neomarinimicrobiota bacterium]MBL7122673.1 class I SAM-dependent methyltransferase [Candidatus Neomarinimicrobiota bacterium]
MGFYETEKGVEDYIKLAKGYDGAELIDWLTNYLPENSSVLELGMGPGKDLDILRKVYHATGSDFSQLFVDRYLKQHPDADVFQLDAVTMDTPRRFDAIYSNKVLQHLSMDVCRQSLAVQHGVLNEGGLVLHALWYGTEYEEFGDLGFQQYTEESFADLLDGRFEILESKIFTEMEKDDSIAFVLKALPA